MNGRTTTMLTRSLLACIARIAALITTHHTKAVPTSAHNIFRAAADTAGSLLAYEACFWCTTLAAFFNLTMVTPMHWNAPICSARVHLANLTEPDVPTGLTERLVATVTPPAA